MLLYILLGLCAILLWRFFKNRDLTDPPMLPGKLPFVGHTLRLLGSRVDLFNNMKRLTSECEILGGVAKLYLGPSKCYFITDPEDCLTVSNECLEKHYVYNYLKIATANGLLVSDVPTWKINRKLLNPAFSQQVLDGFIGIFNQHANSLVKEFDKELGKPFDHEKYLRINNFKIICATSFGVQTEEFGNFEKTFVLILDEGLKLFNELIVTFWYHCDFLYNLSPIKKKSLELAAKGHELANLILQKKKIDRNSKNYKKNESGKLKHFMDFILDLAEDNPSLTDEQIRGETNTIIAGGHDTTATALTIALTLLGSHPRVQEKAYQEIIEILGKSKECVDKYDLSKFVYIEAILKETLRLYPIAPVVMRQIDKDVKLKNFTLKAGYGCMLCLHGTLRHPMWGPDANEFRPERWLEKDSLPPPQYYAGFSLGRRNCIGKVYAMMSMKIILITVLRRYMITSDVNNMVIELMTLIRPKHGFNISLKQRE